MTTHKKIPWQIRQGDVFVERTTKAAAKGDEVPRDGDRVVLAYGEVTGHAHAIRAPGVCLLRAEGVHARVLTVASKCLLQHEEHGEIEIPSGTFTIQIQREWDYLGEMARNVQD